MSDGDSSVIEFPAITAISRFLYEVAHEVNDMKPHRDRNVKASLSGDAIIIRAKYTGTVFGKMRDCTDTITLFWLPAKDDRVKLSIKTDQGVDCSKKEKGKCPLVAGGEDWHKLELELCCKREEIPPAETLAAAKANILHSLRAFLAANTTI